MISGGLIDRGRGRKDGGRGEGWLEHIERVCMSAAAFREERSQWLVNAAQNILLKGSVGLCYC